MDSLESLALRAQEGELLCLEELSRRTREPLRAFLAKRLPAEADADDVAQETLLRAFEHLGRYDPARPFETWLYTIGKRLALNHVRSSKARVARDSHQDLFSEGNTAPVEPAMGLWHKAKDLLPEEAYRALWLRYVQEASIKEVAESLGRTQVSTKVLLYRARKRLLKELTL